MIHINQDGTGDFTSVQAALDSLPADNQEPVTLFIHKGIYRERIHVTVPYVSFVGESAEGTILTYGLYARMPSEDIGKLGTFRTYSCFIDTHDFTASNLTFENSAGPGTKMGQALALYVDGDRIAFHNCRFLGNQDTLFTAPLPPKEIEPNGFVGPKQFAPRVNGRHFYQRCYIEGDIDFIFGGATAYFEGCEFFSKYTGQPISSYVTAASTPEGQEYGYVCQNCHFTGNCPPNSAYLGRPWREYAKVVLLNCQMENHICPEGWNDWGKEFAHDTVFFAEYKSYGPGASMQSRPEWCHVLDEREAKHFSRELVLGGDDGWNP